MKRRAASVVKGKGNEVAEVITGEKLENAVGVVANDETKMQKIMTRTMVSKK
jgi:hypothetical protein